MSDQTNENTAAAVEGAEAPVEKVELTLDQRIEQAEARLAKLRQQKLTESLLNNIEKGDKVTIKFGRADKVRQIEGEVVGVALPNIAVLAGDLETYKVHVRDVVANPTAETRNGVTNTAEIGADGRRPSEAGATASVADASNADDDADQIASLENEGGPVVSADNSADPLENA